MVFLTTVGATPLEDVLGLLATARISTVRLPLTDVSIPGDIPKACLLVKVAPSADSTVLSAFVRRYNGLRPIVIIGTKLDHEIAFSAGKAGAIEALCLPDDRRKLTKTIEKAWAYDEYYGNVLGQLFERRSALEDLTKRERQILLELIKGKSNKEMATTLHLAIKTVEYHRKRMMIKLRLRNAVQLYLLMTNSCVDQLMEMCERSDPEDPRLLA